MKGLIRCAVVLSLALNCSVGDETLPPPCPSEIYCHGPLLQTVQMAKIHEDSKTFVDMKMKFSPKETMRRFVELMDRTDKQPNHSEVKGFVNEVFEPAGQEFEEWDPADWVPQPRFAAIIQDEELKEWVLSLNSVWKVLGRKLKHHINDTKEQYSIIWVPNPVIVPGGRFREFYYWDSYWIIQGLLLSEMRSTVKGMLENFVHMVDNYGHVPNGGRIYYLQRSQPPLLIPMIKLYVDDTGDVQFVKDNIRSMEREFDYWMKEHTKTIHLDGVSYTLATYGDKSKGPRPESYSEDVESAKMFTDEERKQQFYSELKAAAESGWDFSSRWFVMNGTNKGNLTHTKIRSIVPVDLNAILCWSGFLLSEFNRMLGDTERARHYDDKAKKWMEAVKAVLWHEEVGAWLDYDMSNSIRRDHFYPINIAPLWTGCYEQRDKEKIVKLVLKYLKAKKVTSHPGGIPTTLQHTGEQWDYPNAWPPLQHMMIVGLDNTGDEAAQRLAFRIAEKWVRTNYKAYQETDAMLEKYDATILGGWGTGGEYEIQKGFGWTNGIIMELLHRYPKRLTAEDPYAQVALPGGRIPDDPSIDRNSSSSSFGKISTKTVIFISLSSMICTLT